ncbi:L-threonylcarbamoyladenylate synthase [Kocuria varians]|uniref:L-threonylcarbamoyladenylate synthase n=1 Tax=Kocuria varians TaxID=1272 RepID=UPI001EEB7954|nr:L-threonylcarbamoyladenylate synthase [Kocuria varians]
MSEIRPCGSQEELDDAVARAAEVVTEGGCIVLPTDTVYGIGCDAFSAAGVQALLGAKGRTREMPPPVLIARPAVMDGLADEVSAEARALAEAFWPGALTIVCWAQPTLGWDLGETHGTVALRVPDDRVTRAVLERVGPMAVSSANRTGMPAARTARAAQEMLQNRVPLYLDDGVRPVADAASGAQDVASTIVDCTGETPVVLRHGAITLERLREVVPTVHGGAQGESAPATAAEVADSGIPSAGGTAASASTSATGPDGVAGGDATTATGAEADPQAEIDVSDDEIVTSMVLESTVAEDRPVDQGRDRSVRPEPRWGGTSALSMDEARRLVGDPDPDPE